MRNRIIALSFIWISIFDSNAQNVVRHADKNFQPFVRTVKIYPNNNLANQDMRAPIVSLNGNTDLILEFDLLLEDYLALQAKIVHCDADWTQSRLPDIEYLEDFNTFELNDFEYSVNTKTLFVHYVFRIPKTKVSGNYAIKIFQNNDERDVILTRRFVVYENAVNISPAVRLSSGVSSRNFNQQVEFSLNYSSLNTSSSFVNFYVVLRQNQRWDNAIRGLEPTRQRTGDKYLEYKHFTMDNNFMGGNEFRFFDLRTYNYRGQNVSSLNRKSNPITATVAIGESRNGRAYSQYEDLNGQYYIETREPLADILEADYIDVTFQLNSTQKVVNDLFVVGAFNDWQRQPEYRLEYDHARQLYSKTISLKQGVYSYMYYVENDPNYFEGSFHQTENEYDILVYFRAPGRFADRVVGYKTFRNTN